MPKRRYAILTWNNPPEDATQTLSELAYEPDPEENLFSWISGQIEIGEETKTPHIQAVLYRAKGLCFAGIQDALGGVGLKSYNENAEKMREYCNKRKTRVEGTQFEAGIAPQRAMKAGGTSVAKMFDSIKAGMHDEAKLFDTFGSTYARMHTAVNHCINLVQGPKIPEDPDVEMEPTVKVTWIYGDAGTGKTRMVRRLCFQAQKTLYVKNSAMGKWYENYKGEEALTFDDMRASDMSFHEFMQLTDPHRDLDHLVQRKSGVVKLRAKTFFITCDRHPIDFWKSTRLKPNDWAQLKRRLTNIIKMTKYPEYEDVTSEEPPIQEIVPITYVS